ncbi:aminodeoxychorismate/anthranilate synthase component II [Psychrobium sp. 1_MG-2023]|uniref:aminodeoxychorismate/anthranilate synthase component II n=1 Tax=Psychrobium sp. 1_MG-2023 TaxID=3062624 RepID=UPI000C342C41|nr:aminodeoxychorismate/anthranilate synthase component II [Psychrobium sp. 1_MG-2023]MDP2560235.1 aminodeoxychorismate/anthranilate synthase component II [Psychrobium sp. 1_MG-2023]PKF57045.1 anthranilate synthase component II [Alteromonadales bacterium alter-6D02]
MPNLIDCHVFLLDNFDSFTYNLVDQFRVMGATVTIYRNDIDPEFIIAQMNASELPPVLVLSPGPGAPSEAGCLCDLISRCIDKVPMLGICLGHQAIVEAFGGKIGLAPQTVHGKSSAIVHDNTGPFAHLINPMPVARYHSLMAHHVPEQLEVIATIDDIVMAITNRNKTVLGFQFHPESILTPDGEKLLIQSLNHLMTSKERL